MLKLQNNMKVWSGAERDKSETGRKCLLFPGALDLSAKTAAAFRGNGAKWTLKNSLKVSLNVFALVQH